MSTNTTKQVVRYVNEQNGKLYTYRTIEQTGDEAELRETSELHAAKTFFHCL